MRASSRALVARDTPVISSRLPCSVASNSIASGMRAAAPVSATMPSALRSSVISSPAIWATNQPKPPASSRAPVAPAAIVRNPTQRAKPASMSVDGLQRAVDRMPRGPGGHDRNQHHLSKNSRIASESDRERSEERRPLVAVDEPMADHCRRQKYDDSRAAANGAALEPEHQKMMLKMLCDKAVFRSDKMQHLNDRLVGRHGAARGKSHRQDRRGEHQDQDADTHCDRGTCHRPHAIDPAPVV